MGSRLTAEHLLAIYPDPNSVSREQAEEYLPYLVEACREYDITNKNRVAGFLGQLGEESGELVYFEELWGPTPAQEAYEGREDLGNTEPGDGYYFRGSGPIQITGRHNTTRVCNALGIPVDPDLLRQPKDGFRAAAYFWTNMGNDLYDTSNNGATNLNRFADVGDQRAMTYGVNGGFTNEENRDWYYNKAMEVLPDDLDLGEEGRDEVVERGEGVTEPEQVTLRVGENNYLLREGTQEWARVPDLPDGELKTDGVGWVYAEGAYVPGDARPSVEPESLEERIRRVTAYNWQLVEADIPYMIWREGMFINIDGPPGYGVDGPAPDPSEIVAIFCAGVGNVDRRLLGLPVPKHREFAGWDGGTAAWEHNFWDVSVSFDLDQAEEGDIAFQRWCGSEGAQGHWAYCTGGADDPVIQSYPNTFEGSIVEPGMDANATLRRSHDGGFYEVLIKARDWMT